MSSRRSFLKKGLIISGALSMSSTPCLAVKSRSVGQIQLINQLKSINRSTHWNQVDAIKVKFKTFHPQGMVKIGEEIWFSSVEVKPKYAGDRSSGIGHLFKMNLNGELFDDLILGEGSIYHPGGIDFDGTHIWVSVAEYRPNSRSIIYRIDPSQKSITEIFRWNDHIGSISRNPDNNCLYGVSWGSRKFFRWSLSLTGFSPTEFQSEFDSSILQNPNNYIDFQDNQYLGNGIMLYSGLATYSQSEKSTFSLGGVELVDVDVGRAIHQFPIQLWSPKTTKVMTQNPCFFESITPERVRAYFLPDDNESMVFVYETSVEPVV